MSTTCVDVGGRCRQMYEIGRADQLELKRAEVELLERRAEMEALARRLQLLDR